MDTREDKLEDEVKLEGETNESSMDWQPSIAPEKDEFLTGESVTDKVDFNETDRKIKLEKESEENEEGSYSIWNGDKLVYEEGKSAENDKQNTGQEREYSDELEGALMFLNNLSAKNMTLNQLITLTKQPKSSSNAPNVKKYSITHIT